MYYIETNIILELLGITKRTLYNYRYGRITPTKVYRPIMDVDDIFIVMVDHKQVSYITQNGVEAILNN